MITCSYMFVFPILHWQIVPKRKIDTKYCRDKKLKNCRYGVRKHQLLLYPHLQTCHERKESHSFADKKENLTVTPQVEKLRRIFLLRICKKCSDDSHFKPILPLIRYLTHTRYLTDAEFLLDMNRHQQVPLLSHLQGLLLSVSFTFRDKTMLQNSQHNEKTLFWHLAKQLKEQWSQSCRDSKPGSWTHSSNFMLIITKLDNHQLLSTNKLQIFHFHFMFRCWAICCIVLTAHYLFLST